MTLAEERLVKRRLERKMPAEERLAYFRSAEGPRRVVGSTQGSNTPRPPCRACSLLSIVIPTIDEEPTVLQRTLDTINKGTVGPLEIILVDDTSAKPVPGATIRNRIRLGATRSRHLGGTLAKGKFVCFPDAHMKIGAGNLRKLCGIAAKTKGIAYMGCNGHIACEMSTRDGLPLAIWTKSADVPKKVSQFETTAMMGACYVMLASTLEKMGGWVQLPGALGFQEVSMSVLATKCGIPITCLFGGFPTRTRLENWHQFRPVASATWPYGDYPLNQAVWLRLMFGDEAWGKFAVRLATKTGKRPATAPEILREAQSPQFVKLGEELKARMTMSDEEFLAPYAKDLKW